MFDLFRLWLGAVLRGFRTRRSLMLENLALRQQLTVFKRQQPRPRLGAIDKLFWVVTLEFLGSVAFRSACREPVLTEAVGLLSRTSDPT